MLNDASLLTWIIACGGWAIAIFTTYLGYAERREIRKADLLLRTVSYFEGGTQKRSIGIALVEGMQTSDKANLGVLVPLLVNQLVYLLLHPDVKDSPHEQRNVVRIYLLLKSIFANLEFRKQFTMSWCEVGDAIGRRLEGETSGLDISKITLLMWLKELGHEVPRDA